MDQAVSQSSDVVLVHRTQEAKDVIDSSDDEVFQTDLYDWYLSLGQASRLLEIQSPFVTAYLQRKSIENIEIAEMLAKYYIQVDRPHEAAQVQLTLAQSAFEIPLSKRIEFLSRAKANASTYGVGVGRSNRQKMLHEITDLLDVANIQDDTLQRLRDDERLAEPQRGNVLAELDGEILTLSDV